MVLDILGMEILSVMSHNVDAEDQTQVLQKTISVLNHWAISPVSYFNLNIGKYQTKMDEHELKLYLVLF